jgi:uncharacterized membrane protein
MTAGSTLSPAPRRPPRHRVGLTGLRQGPQWEQHPGVRSPEQLTRRERAAAWVGDRIGSWTFVAVTVVLLEVGMVVAIREDEVDGAIAVLGVVVSGLVLLDLSVLFMAIRRADRTAAELAMHHLESARRTTTALEELGAQVERVAVDLARLDARLRTRQQPPAREETRR